MSGRKKYHEGSSPLTFGARGSNIKPYVTPEDVPSLPPKADRSERRGIGAEIKRKDVDINGVGLGIHGHDIRERVGMI
jgi:hypothetical protein